MKGLESSPEGYARRCTLIFPEAYSMTVTGSSQFRLKRLTSEFSIIAMSPPAVDWPQSDHIDSVCAGTGTFVSTFRGHSFQADDLLRRR
jgi:hypothetical protein